MILDVMPVTIGEDVGSVVTKSIPAYCVAAGSPCRVLRFLERPAGT